MIDEKDIEIAKLRGQVEALEKMVRQLIVAPPPVAPIIIQQPAPNPPPQPGTYPFWWDTTVVCGGPQRIAPDMLFANPTGIS